MAVEKCLLLALPTLLAFGCATGSTLGEGGFGSGGTGSGVTSSTHSATGNVTNGNGVTTGNANTSAVTSAQSSNAVTTNTSANVSSSTGGTTNCNPLSPAAACGANNHCFPTTNGMPVCAGPTGTGSAYTACASATDCAPANQCVDTNDPTLSPCCLQWCASNGDCAVGTCTFFTPSIFVGTTEYGACYDGMGGC